MGILIIDGRIKGEAISIRRIITFEELSAIAQNVLGKEATVTANTIYLESKQSLCLKVQALIML